MKFSVVIPNWNGRKLLEKNLPAVLAANPDEVLVVDDASPDNSNEFLSKKYPSIKIVKHNRNLGFSAACNSGVKQARGEIIVLLNVDVVPEKSFLKPLISNFSNPKIFAVSLNEENWSWARLIWKNGFVEHCSGDRTKSTHYSAWASGGSGAFRKPLWEDLGGLNEIFRPFYWEDVDLGYRAWKQGYEILWEPSSIVHHQHEAVIGSHFSKNYINMISERNRLLFIWKNITDDDLMREHIINLGRKLVSQPKFCYPFLKALTKIGQVSKSHKNDRVFNKLTDEEIFQKFCV